ncbi:hypothetical protein Droror1_Dr00021856 [Drosera rotundifolia]
MALPNQQLIIKMQHFSGHKSNTLPPSLVEYQRLRCRVAFHALSFRNEILALRHQMVQSSCCSWRAACCLLTEMTEVLLLKVEACIRPMYMLLLVVCWNQLCY